MTSTPPADVPAPVVRPQETTDIARSSSTSRVELKGRSVDDHHQSTASPTERLYYLCESAGYDPTHPLLADPASAVRHCVERGADPMTRDSRRTTTLLHRLTLNGCAAAVEACLPLPQNSYPVTKEKDSEIKHEQPNEKHKKVKESPTKQEGRHPIINFACGDISYFLTAQYHVLEKTLLQVACERWVTDVATERMLTAMVRYILSWNTTLHADPEVEACVQVDWEKKDWNGLDMLAIAARYQKLSLVWPIVRDVPYFAAKKKQKIRTTTTGEKELSGGIFLPFVWEWDWKALGETTQKEFFVLTAPPLLQEGRGDPVRGPTETPLPITTRAKPFAEHSAAPRVTEIIKVCKPTAELCKLSWLPHPEPEAIRRCLMNGADLHLVDPMSEEQATILHNFFIYGDVAGLRACLGLPTEREGGKETMKRAPQEVAGGQGGRAGCETRTDHDTVVASMESRSPARGDLALPFKPGAWHVDLTVTDGSCRHTPLHCLWMRFQRRDRCAMLHAVIDRFHGDDDEEKAANKEGATSVGRSVYGHPMDKIDWGQKDVFDDFITAAADRKELSLIWPILKQRRVPYYGPYVGAVKNQDEVEKQQRKETIKTKSPTVDNPSGDERTAQPPRRIPITCVVDAQDWAGLSEEDQARFECVAGVRGRWWGSDLYHLWAMVIMVAIMIALAAVGLREGIHRGEK